MKKYFFLIAQSLLVSQAALAAKPPFKAPEGTQFATEQEMPFLAYGEVPAFEGVLVRESESNSLRTIKLYHFKNHNEIRVTSNICREVVRQILGPEQKNDAKITRQEVVSGPRGTICETRVTTPGTRATIRQRDFRIGLMSGNLYAIEAKYRQSSTPEEDKEFKDFFNALK